ncbi:hypothetical protein HDU67_008202 [Dinochytrium kinnereticum]|nr:hypothetical protein HDU67_008202 [Dinochytrium kinnereticum]
MIPSSAINVNIPVYAPRTSSLKDGGESSPERPPAVISQSNTWTGFLSSFGSGKNSSQRPLSRHPNGRDNAELYVNGKDESRLDSNASESELLALLEQENASLRLDPKSVLVEEGAIMADLTTLQTLTQYHTKMTSPLDAEETSFWNSILEEASEAKDSNSCISKLTSLLTAKIRRGVPPHLRNQIWQIMAGAQPRALEDVYQNLLTEDSSAERIIKRDIPRTFPKLELFKDEDGRGQKSLFNLLKAYSVFDRECGYCQGLSFVVAPLLLQNMTEIEAFALFVRLMEENPSRDTVRKYGLRTLFMPQMPGLHLLLYQHSELVRLYLPRLFGHFVQNSIMADTYASPWFLTLFTYNFPLPLVFRIFDIIFAEGATETMLRFSIAILKRNQENILRESELEGILEFLKGGRLYKIYEDDPEKVVQDAMELDTVITTQLLEKINRNYVAEKTSRRSSEMEVKQLRWETQRLLAENARLSRDVSNLRESLRTAEERRLRDIRKLVSEFESTIQKLREERGKDASVINELQEELDRSRSNKNGWPFLKE